MTSLEERFWKKVRKTDSCWIWRASVNADGYGRFCVSRADTGAKAHRIAYTLVKGKIPEGMTLHHVCRNRRCVNPEHLEPISRNEHTKTQHKEDSIGIPLFRHQNGTFVSVAQLAESITKKEEDE